MEQEKPRLGISACLLGQRVRYDGAHKRDAFLTDIFGRYVEWVAVCPELEAGMGVPRETVRLVGTAASPRMVAEKSGKDWTPAMTRFAANRVTELTGLDLSGYVFKKDSPSCGLERVRIYHANNLPARSGRGLFAAAVTENLPLLPVEEEGRLNDPALRENFIERVFAYHRWQNQLVGRKSIATLVNFHTEHKFLLLAHSEHHYRRLGRIVAVAKQNPIRDAYEEYGRFFMAGMAVRATAKKHANVLDHMMGYFSQRLSPEERAELVQLIKDFRHQRVPLIVPITLVRHYVRKYQLEYLANQAYLDPSPKELMLRNHV
ncbi:MAG: YbgA family protein [Candidatus Binatia bacterium]